MIIVDRNINARGRNDEPSTGRPRRASGGARPEVEINDPCVSHDCQGGSGPLVVGLSCGESAERDTGVTWPGRDALEGEATGGYSAIALGVRTSPLGMPSFRLGLRFGFGRAGRDSLDRGVGLVRRFRVAFWFRIFRGRAGRLGRVRRYRSVGPGRDGAEGRRIAGWFWPLLPCGPRSGEDDGDPEAQDQGPAAQKREPEREHEPRRP